MRPLLPIPPDIVTLAHHQEGLVSKAQCDAAGLSRQRVARLIEQRRWRRATSGVYDTDGVLPHQRRRDDFHDHLRRRTAWVGLLAFTGAIAVGACSLALHRVQGLPQVLVPEVALPGGAHRRGRDGILVRQYRTFPTSRIGPRLVARIDHALAQALPGMSREQGVAVLSSTLNRSLLDAAQLSQVHTLLRGCRGAESVHGWFDLAEVGDESPAESSARLSCIDNGVPPDDTQVVFTLRGRFLARVDLAWLLPDGRWLVVEIDGLGPHGRPEALVKDSLRQNGLLGTDRIILLRFRPAENARPGGIGAVVAQHLARLGWISGQQVTRGLKIDLPEARQRPRSGSRTS
ncbi:type IV toxin-antitoxin system AbiEi family antitoxin domain-containing protein [Antribacter gilvus]|uniref:type IV toxin-antitoxin system AbiEi family antitoxin domain-containing protein n=1 Tax=Antribacter gilvus TaxID=2304675 RepID=UPI0013E0728A|nr:type IV toxin-antitoxin system AbiEi family antitoxin domain-containing protein [Antribacter gilvus]